MTDTESIILDTDSYKPSQWLQYPPGTEGYFGYIAARAAQKTAEPISETVFFGLQIYLHNYLINPITRKDIEEAAEFLPEHGEPFNREGWEYILEKYGGFIPVTIKAVPEGIVVPEGNVLVTIECEDPKCFWVAGYVETAIMRVWYPCTVATISRRCKKVINDYLELTSDSPKDQIMLKLHDFGSRGVSSPESSGIGGAAHLVNFMGSDNIRGIRVANKHYKIKMAGVSIVASEHSTITSWGRDREVEAYRNMIKTFGGQGKIFACVSDSYDIFNACRKIWGEELRQEVIDSGATIVIRPDSGNPAETVVKCLKILDEKFGSTSNKKGYKVLNFVRVIQGDGINEDSIREICKKAMAAGFSIDNIAFGMGGALLQHLNRDTLRFAMKCSATKRNGSWYDAYKSPIGDPIKKSMAGRLSLYRVRNGHGAGTRLVTMRQEIARDDSQIIENVLRPVYINGNLLNESTFDEVRQRASL